MKYPNILKFITIAVIFIIVSQENLFAQNKSNNSDKDVDGFFSNIYIQAPIIGFSPCYLGSSSSCYGIAFWAVRTRKFEKLKKYSRIGGSSYNGRFALYYAFTNFTIKPVVSVGIDFGRKFDDGKNVSRPINRLSKIQSAIVFGGGLKFEYKRFTLTALGFQDVSGNRKGFDGVINIKNPFIVTRDQFYITPQVSLRFADQNFLNTELGITKKQAISSAANYDPVADLYSTNAGLYVVGTRISADYYFNDYAFVRFKISYDRLLDKVANSPIVSKFGSKSQIGMSASFNFKLWD